MIWALQTRPYGIQLNFLLLIFVIKYIKVTQSFKSGVIALEKKPMTNQEENLLCGVLLSEW